MALPFVTLVYTVPAKSVPAASVVTALSAIPVPEATLEALGVYCATDNTAAVGASAVRTIVLRTDSTVEAAATHNLNGGDSGSPIESVTVSATGLGYVRPPVFLVKESAAQTLSDFLTTPGKGGRVQSYLGVVSGEAGVNLLSAGAGYSAQTTAALIGGMPLGLGTIVQAKPGTFVGSTGTGVRQRDPAANGALNTLGVVSSVAVTSQGRGYSAGTKAVVVGADPAPGGRPARGYATIVNGKIVAVTLTDSGMGYITVPQWAFIDPTGAGSGAEAVSSMQRGKPATLHVAVDGAGHVAISITDPGDGYVAVPQLVIWDPTGAGVGAAATVGPVVNGAASVLGVSRVDVTARGQGYVVPVLEERSFFEAAYLASENASNVTEQLRPFVNLMKTAIQNALLTEVTESIS